MKLSTVTIIVAAVVTLLITDAYKRGKKIQATRKLLDDLVPNGFKIDIKPMMENIMVKNRNSSSLAIRMGYVKGVAERSENVSAEVSQLITKAEQLIVEYDATSNTEYATAAQDLLIQAELLLG